MKIRDVKEGYTVLPPMNRERYQERPGLEGPFPTRSGKVVYYDPKEGAYYDPDTDMYLTYDEWKTLDNEGSEPTREERKMVVKKMGTLSDKHAKPVDETRIKPNKSARAYVDQMDAAHGQIYGGGTQKPPASLMKAIRDEEAARRKQKTQEANINSGATYLIVPRTHGSVDLTKWALVNWEGREPLHLRTVLTQRAKELGWEHYDVFTQWTGDIDTAIEQAKKKADQYESRKDEFPAQYWDGKKTAEKLKDAKEIMADGEEAGGAIDEATDPRDVISKFLKSKEQRSERGQQLRKDRDAKLVPDEQPIEEAIASGDRAIKDLFNKMRKNSQYEEYRKGMSYYNVPGPKLRKDFGVDPEQMWQDSWAGDGIKGAIDKSGAANLPRYNITWNNHAYESNEEALTEYKPGVTVLTREISFADLDGSELSNHYNPDEEYATVKKIRWPYGIEVSFDDRNRTVRFKTAKMKTVARILEKHIDFGATSATEVLELPQELMQSADEDDNLSFSSYQKAMGYVPIDKATLQSIAKEHGATWNPRTKSFDMDGGDELGFFDLDTWYVDEDFLSINEAVSKIACTKCDEVSTAAAWKKNNGFCPKCKTSSQGVAEASYRDSGYKNMHKADQKANRQADKDRERAAKLAAKKKETLPLDEAPAVIPFASEFKSLINRFQTEIDWDNVEAGKEGGTTTIIGSKNGKEYFINFAHPRKKGTTLVTGWWFVDVVVGNMYLGKKYFTKTGEAIVNNLAQTLKPIIHIRLYKEMVNDGTIEANIAEAEKALEKLKSHLNNNNELKEAMPNMGKKVVVAQKGNKVGEFTVPANAQVHHINQELRQIKGLSLGDFERTQVARDLASGKIARAGNYAFKVIDNRPQEMR